MTSGWDGSPQPLPYESPQPGYGVGAPPPVYSGGPSGPRAGFWIRFVASLVDSILLGMLNSLLRLAVPDPLALLAGIAIGFAYFGYFEGGPAGQTLGKLLLDIRVVRSADGGPLGWSTALLRYLCSFLSAIPFGLGYFWMLWDEEKQTWHDKLSSTVVVPAAAWPPPSGSFAKPPVA